MSQGEGPREGDFEVVTLRNGHRAVRHLPSGEVMHPAVGPAREAALLYDEQLRLAERLKAGTDEPLRIYDVGLGAASNALAALHRAASTTGDRRSLEIVSFERDLAPLRLAVSAGFGLLMEDRWRLAVQTLLERGAWRGEGMSWSLRLGEFLTELERVDASPELVYFDPFSPEVNPELWTVAAFEQLRRRCAQDGRGTVLATYSAGTPTRVSLLLAGFHVGYGVGVGSKRETTVAATRRELLERPLGPEFLARWRRSSAQAPHGGPPFSDWERRLVDHSQFCGR